MMRQIKLSRMKGRKFGFCASCREPSAISGEELCDKCSDRIHDQFSAHDQAALMKAFGDLYD